MLWLAGGICGIVAVPACPEGVTAGPEAVSAGRGPVVCMKGELKAGMELGSIP